MISVANLPLHLAIIPDGNRRWAKKNRIKNEIEVYEKGASKISEIMQYVFDMGITYLTVWASSYFNIIDRPRILINALEEVYTEKFKEISTHPLVTGGEIRVSVAGEWKELLKDKTIRSISETIAVSSPKAEKVLTILMAYDGRRERGSAMRQAVERYLSSQETIPEDLYAADQSLRINSWTGDLPDVDLVVRTGSAKDPHNSAGFLSLLTGDSQFSFPDVLWPDLATETLSEILDDFSQRQRRLGR